MNERDYQWPIGKCAEKIVLQIQNYFEDRLQVPSKFFPSGRVALSAILKFLGAHRAHTIFAPKWSSECVWGPIVAHSNPTTSFRCEPEYVLAVHKWGIRSDFSKPYLGITIEDSVDSIFTSESAIFSLGSQFDFISLPKIIGASWGAIVFSKDTEFLETYENTFLDESKLSQVDNCLSNYEHNLSVIQRRLDQIEKHLGCAWPFGELSGRYPSNYPLPKSRTIVVDESIFMTRHFDVNRQLDKPMFEPCYLLPLHFGVSDEFFNRLLTQVRIR